MKKFIIFLTEETEDKEEISITSMHLENDDMMGLIEDFKGYTITILKIKEKDNDEGKNN